MGQPKELTPGACALIDERIAKKMGLEVKIQPDGEWIYIKRNDKETVFSPTRLWRDTGLVMEMFDIWPKRWLTFFFASIPMGATAEAETPQLAACFAALGYTGQTDLEKDV